MLIRFVTSYMLSIFQCLSWFQNVAYRWFGECWTVHFTCKCKSKLIPLMFVIKLSIDAYTTYSVTISDKKWKNKDNNQQWLSHMMQNWLPAWWALWLLWWPLTDAAMFQCVYGYLQSVFFFLVLFHCCILLEIKLTTTTTTTTKIFGRLGLSFIHLQK